MSEPSQSDYTDYTEPDYSALSIKDLLEARETYHLYLSNLGNVVGTAVGKYLIRRADPDATDASKVRERNKGIARTLANTTVKDWSWPCILVFVDRWLSWEELRNNPEKAIPKHLYLPDGRAVPLCIVEAEKRDTIAPPLESFSLPNQLMGGGYPIFSFVQGQEHMGTLGCLVTDGDRIYGLTNRHVVGERTGNEAGRRIFSFVSGKTEQQDIGTSSNKQVGKKIFKEVYHGWPGTYSYSVIDAGLIELGDVTDWTAQVYGIGEIAEPMDLNVGNISLKILGCPVRAFGGASGEMKGEVKALFYRFKSMGGFDYVADLLIGPRGEQEGIMTREGDSGTVWFFDPQIAAESKDQKHKEDRGERARRFEPIALQWGGQKFVSGKQEGELSFALATCISTICRELDVDIVRDWNVGYGEYWGKLGHYKIAAKACELVTNKKLKSLMMANLKNISFDDQVIASGNIPRFEKDQFVPLADVPDLAWGTWKRDGNNHFADMDQEGKGEFAGKTLLDLTKNPNNVNIGVWNKFYDSIAVEKRGALPFRIWQVYDEAVKTVKAQDVARFVCAAGILGHYAADASEPLHVSQYHHGRDKTEDGVHSAYETKMLDACAAEIVAGVNQCAVQSKVKYTVKDGHAAAMAGIEVMRKVLVDLPPLVIVEAYNDASHTVKTMYKSTIDKYQIGEKTAVCMTEGCLLLAALWDSAWKEGNGKTIPQSKLVQIDSQELKKLYLDKEFLRSYKLDDPKFAAALT
jgi:hypothetical protein